MAVYEATNAAPCGSAPSWVTEYGPFLRTRRAHVGFRLGATAIIAICFGAILGWAAILAWFGLYAALQVLELLCFDQRLHWLPEQSRRGGYLALVFLVLNSTAWAAISSVDVARLGDWGIAYASNLLAGGILITVLTTINCRTAFIFAILPYAFFAILIPLDAWHRASPPSGAVVLFLIVAGLMTFGGAILLWRQASKTKAAEMAAILRDISERKNNEQRLYLMAHRDALTGLANRAVLQSTLARLVGGSEAAALLLIDLDGFKFINDTLGHFAGDQVLIEVARRLEDCARAGDITMRLGGDEFAVLLAGVGELQLASEISDRIILNISRPLVVDGNQINISASIGIVTYPAHGDDPVRLFANADLALYRAKADGRHCSRLYHSGLREEVNKKLLQDAALLHAIEQNEFELFYQPQVQVTDGAVIAAEALLRWRHPVRGLLEPAEFLAAIEASPFAARIGDWVMQTACEQAAIWRRKGLPKFRVAVNLFGAQFRSGSLVEKVIYASSRVNLPPDALEIEITENTILRHEDDVVVPLTQLRALGFWIVFDDYGTGYASLSLLKRYPLSGLKIDKGFTQAICEKPSDAAIVRAIISLGEAFELKVIAEGVETEEQARMLATDGCMEIQGNYFGRPVSVADFTALYVSGAQVRIKIGLS